jgi:hypothetical protein
LTIAADEFLQIVEMHIGTFIELRWIMEPAEFLKTIYLGDRACKRLLLDGWNNRVELQVDVISRVRDPSGHWNFYTDEDINDGLIVFSQVSSIKLSPSGPVPNDYINSFEVHPLDKKNNAKGCKQLYVFQLSVSSVDPQGNSCEVYIDIVAEDVHLEDPQHPGIVIP